MPYSVDVSIDAENFSHELSQMRVWLDHMKYEPVNFSKSPSKNIYRIDFKNSREAKAFARAFSALVLDRVSTNDENLAVGLSSYAADTTVLGKVVTQA
jgi:hypothetical protein